MCAALNLVLGSWYGEIELVVITANFRKFTDNERVDIYGSGRFCSKSSHYSLPDLLKPK